MENNKSNIKPKRSIAAKIGWVFTIFILSVIALVVLILIAIQTTPVQNFARKKIVSFLENKLNTKVAINRLDIDFPKMLVLEGVYIEDKTKDTLIAGSQLKVDIDMLKLIKSEIQINEINLNGITVKVKRQLPDTVFNFQFIVDAFASPKKVSADTTPIKMAIEKVIVDKTRMVYKDVVSGNDVDIFLNHFDTKIKTFDLSHLKYEVPNIVINGLKGTIKQSKPLEITVVKTNPDSTVANEPPAFINFINTETLIKDVDVAYVNEVSAMSTRIAFKDLTVHPQTFDLKNSIVAIKDIELNDLNGFLKMDKLSGQPVVKMTTEKGAVVKTEAMPWKFTIGSMEVNNNNFTYDDNTKPRQPKGMDYAHLGLQNLTLHARDFLMHNDTISTRIIEGSMKEKSGFELNKFQTDVVYTNTGASLQNIFIQTPGTEIKKGIVLRYPSIEAIEKEIGLLELNMDIDNSFIQVKDILTFVPALASQPAFNNPNTKLYINSKVNGSLNRLTIDKFQFHGIGNTVVDVSGTVSNAMDAKNAGADLTIKRFSTTRSDIVSLAPKGTIPTNITIPETMNVTGKVKGSMKDATADLFINTSLGNARINGNIANAADKINARYNALVSVNNLNVGRIIQQPQNVGIISASFKVNGKGYDPERTNASLKGIVSSAVVKQYNYRNLQLNATIVNQKFSANALIKDPNIDLTINAKGDIGGKLPGFFVEADIDSIKTLPLHLTPDPIYYHGKITANFPELNLDALNGELYVVNSVLVMNGQQISMDSISVLADHQNNEQTIALKTDFVNAQLQGQYKLQQLGDIMMEAIQPYYALAPKGKLKQVDSYNFTLNADVIDHPTIHGFVPDLKRFEGMKMTSSFSSSDGINAKIAVPYVVYGTNAIDSVNINASTSGNTLTALASVNQVKVGTSLALYNTRFTAALADNKIDFGLLIKDKLAVNKYRLAGLLSQEPNSVFAFSLKPDSLLLNYSPWTINNDNLIRFGAAIVNARNFNLSKGDQHLVINSVSDAPNSPLTVDFSKFQIATLTGFVMSDSLPVDGMLNGNIQVRDLLKQPNFTTDLTLNSLSFKKDTIGDVNVKVNNNIENVFATNVTITGRGNDIGLSGNYYLKPANNSDFKFKLDIRQLPFKTIESLSFGAINQSTGNLTGAVDISGKAASPNIDGDINFNKTGFNVVMLGSYFTIDNEAIKVNNTGIRFDTFTIKDSANNSLVVDGLAGTTNFVSYNLDLTVKARNFRAINTVKKQNSLYYGQLYFNTNLSIKGTETAPVVDGSFKVNENTSLTIVLPQAEPGIEDRKGVIEFVDMDAPGNDSLFKHLVATYDSSFNKTAIAGFDVSANISVDKNATFNIIVDEANGDFLQLKGEAVLNGGIDPSGKITLTGSYEIESGGYDLSFNFIHRRFDIQKGSKITWTGEPTTAQIDITAVYVANTSPIDLVNNQISDPAQRGYYQQKLPFNVKLNVKGELMKPDLTFDIDLPKDGNLRVNNEVLTTVNTRLDQIKTEPSELNKQVFALLLLNRFVGDNPFQSSGDGGGFNATSYAKQSVSKILTEQLNKLAGNLIAGVDINFDLNSEEDYSTGARRDKTDFNVSLSKRLLSDRLKVSVGSNYELEGPQQGKQNGTNLIGNLSVDYNLTQDGRYMLRGYRKNDYDYVLEGQVVETGLKFIISADYNKLKDLLRKKKKPNPAAKNSKKDTNTDKQTTGTNTPNEEGENALTFINKTFIADDRKNVPATVNDSTNVQ